MKNYLTLMLTIVIFATVHEGTHALVSITFDEYKAFHIRPYGLEVEYKTPLAEREGIKWGFIAGASNVLTLSLGCLMFFFKVKISRLRRSFLNSLDYWLIFFFLLIDAFNLSIGSFIYGGDIGGLALGFGINLYLVQFVFLMLLLFNREVVVRKFFPLCGVKTKHPPYRPWMRLSR